MAGDSTDSAGSRSSMMARIKHTKNEMKAQREALYRYERFLPMLQLKKQQLQAEILALDQRIEAKKRQDRQIRADLEKWIRLFSEPVSLEFRIRVASVQKDEANIAGVSVPVFLGIAFDQPPLDLFATPPWMDDGLETLANLIQIRVELDILREHRRLISDELRTTSQRVNLFEKVKIPESRENIRVIKIFLGDEQTAGVARAKIAKDRITRAEEEGILHAPAAAEESGVDGP